MRLSKLQKHILIRCYYCRNGRLFRETFEKFYDRYKKKPKPEDIVNVITKSLERLIDRELLIGYGVRTPHRWFIKEVKLTKQGHKVARKLIKKQQQKLPF